MKKRRDILSILKDEINHIYHFPLRRVYSQSQTGRYSGNMAAAELSSNIEKLNTEPVYCICVDLWDTLRLAGSHVVKNEVAKRTKPQKIYKDCNP